MHDLGLYFLTKGNQYESYSLNLQCEIGNRGWFHQRFSRAFFVRTSFFYLRFVLFVQKTHAKNVGEIDPRCW